MFKYGNCAFRCRCPLIRTTGSALPPSRDYQRRTLEWAKKNKSNRIVPIASDRTQSVLFFFPTASHRKVCRAASDLRFAKASESDALLSPTSLRYYHLQCRNVAIREAWIPDKHPRMIYSATVPPHRTRIAKTSTSQYQPPTDWVARCSKLSSTFPERTWLSLTPIQQAI